MGTITEFLGWAGADLNTFLEKRYPRTFESLPYHLRWRVVTRTIDLSRRIVAMREADEQRVRRLCEAEARLIGYIVGGAS